MFIGEWVNWLFNVTINDISVIYKTAHRRAGGLKKKLDLRSGSQRHRHFVWFFNVPMWVLGRFWPIFIDGCKVFIFIKVIKASAHSFKQFFILYFVASDALLAGRLVPCKWNQAWRPSELYMCIEREKVDFKSREANCLKECALALRNSHAYGTY